MYPNLSADLQSGLERLTDYLTDCARQCPALRHYSFSYENGQWMAVSKGSDDEPVEDCYERNLKKLLAYIEQHYNRDITEEYAAGVIGLSVSAFCRFFKQRMACSFVAYKNKVRIRQAAQALRTMPRYSCEQVGMDCGFSSYSYFKRVFEGEYGVSPKEYRKNLVELSTIRLTYKN